MTEAFGGPGLGPTWTSSDKDFVTTALGGTSRVWLTLGHGIGNEIYWPSTGQPQVRDLGFIVTSRGGWTEVKRAARYALTSPAPAVLAPTVIHRGDGWTLRLDWAVDPNRDVVLVGYELDGEADGLYVLVAPHLGAGGHANTAWVDESLHAMAEGAETSLCVVCDQGFERVSAGYVGASDGWQDLARHGEMRWSFDRATDGNVALTARLPLPSATLAVGLATTPEGATSLARGTLADGARSVSRRFTAGWERFAGRLDTSQVPGPWRPLTEHSAAVLACHEDRTYPGATVASLSIPWGNQRDDLGGYHLVWARDCVEVAFARLAIGDVEAADRTLSWLVAAQQADGHWTQNAYPDGRPFWTGVQLDEVALPVLLAAALGHEPGDGPVGTMVRRAVDYLVTHGPASPQDRWEENAGANAFTLATIVAALVAASPWLAAPDAAYAASLARYWNDRIEDWLYVTDGPLCQGRDIAGYYIRLGRTDDKPGPCGRIDVRNQTDLHVEADRLISCDFLALARFGLRSAGDQRIVDTVTLIDELLAVALPTGVAYRRYNGDGYGEHDDGSPFDGTGVGRPWPLLAGERGHYAAQTGCSADRYLESMAAMTGRGQLLPEQVWDGAPLPDRFLESGRPTGSAMPLAWAHAEYIKLATFASRQRPIELLPQVAEGLARGTTRPAWYWRTDLPFSTAAAGREVVIDHPDPFVLRADGVEEPSRALGCGRHGVTLRPELLGQPFELSTGDGSPIASGRVGVDPSSPGS